MNKSILIAAAAAAGILSGLTSFTPTAEAGGIRVGFGMPLGSFVARPTRGGYASSNSSGMCKKKSPSYASRSRPEPHSTQAHKETKVASHDYSEPKKSSSVDHAEQETSNSNNGEDSQTGATGSSALIQGDSKNGEVTTVEIPADLPAETPAGSTATIAANTPAETPATSASEAPAVTETPAAPVVVEEPKSKKSKTARKDDCSKYIPAIGVTVSVGC